MVKVLACELAELLTTQSNTYTGAGVKMLQNAAVL